MPLAFLATATEAVHHRCITSTAMQVPIALVSGSGERREPPAVVEEVGEFSADDRPFGRPKDAAPKLVAILRLTDLRRKSRKRRGFYLGVHHLCITK